MWASSMRSVTRWQSGSARRSVRYQVTPTRPALPAAIHGQNTRLEWARETVIGCDHVRPEFFE